MRKTSEKRKLALARLDASRQAIHAINKAAYIFFVSLNSSKIKPDNIWIGQVRRLNHVIPTGETLDGFDGEV